MELSNALKALFDKPIEHTYTYPSKQDIASLKSRADAKVIDRLPNIKLVNSYRVLGLQGTLEEMYARESLVDRINQIAKIVGSHFGLMVFDAYRSLDTQNALYSWMCDQVRTQHPTWSDDQIQTEARIFATDPMYRPHAVPPHNSGGAIDLALYDLSTGGMLAFGSEFDEATERSRTDFYESPFDASFGVCEEEWFQVRGHRRLLFHLMKDAGFTNYSNEWWHYDLGDCMWALIHGIDWQYDRLQI